MEHLGSQCAIVVFSSLEAIFFFSFSGKGLVKKDCLNHGPLIPKYIIEINKANTSVPPCYFIFCFSFTTYFTFTIDKLNTAVLRT